MLLHWNDDWLFTPEFTPDLCEENYYGPPLQAVRLPHTVKTLPYNYCSEQDYQLVSGYRREFYAPEAWKGRRILLTFGAAAHEATVWCNGQQVAQHRCGYTAFTVDLTDLVCCGGKNVIAVRCDSRESLDQPPFGHVIDYLTYGGIYRGVTLEIKEQVWLQDVFVTAGADGAFRLYPTVAGEHTGYQLHARLYAPDGNTVGTYIGSADAPLGGVLHQVLQWHPDHPYLYTLRVQLVRPGNAGCGTGDHVADETTLRFGFRTIQFRADGLYLNGRKLKLRGLDRHQCWAYQGYAMPDSLQKQDAWLLKNELGCNAVRTSHYPQSHAFLDACDELGLLVFTEIPGWQHFGGSDWKQQAIANTREMVLQYRNHTSIFLWGVRINESADDDELYKKTNEVAHRLDPTRPTGGVRNFKNSHFFEDVYTYNDFVHCGGNPGCEPKRSVTADMRRGYLVTEYNGHMFPTKAFDWEGKRTEHLLRHARVLADVAAQADIGGSFGWCMFDYNTHKDFGSGDRICYHGVMDMFRNPKPAAAVYASQRNIDGPDSVVLEVCSSMDIGDHPAGTLPDVVALTNADSVKLYKNDTFVAEFYPDRQGTYGALAHPPILVDDLIGCLLEQQEGLPAAQARQLAKCLNAIRRDGLQQLTPLVKAQIAKLMVQLRMSYSDCVALYGKYVSNWGQDAVRYRFDAVYRGEVVARMVKEPVTAVTLQAECLNPVLVDGPTWDAAAIRLRAVDQNGNTLPYFAEAARITVDGPARLLGPELVPLRGGMAGVYLASVGRAGAVIVTIECAGCAPVRLTLEVQVL